MRDGRIHGERPQILTADHYSRLSLEGFGEKTERYIEQPREHAQEFAGASETIVSTRIGAISQSGAVE